MRLQYKIISKVKKFNLALDSEKIEYEYILNNSNCEIIRDEFSYTKSGLPIITVWWNEKIKEPDK